jgi:uncharacterized membrane protein YgdD (TMEM256/DUF423 family)
MARDASLGRVPVVAGALLLALATIAGALGAHARPAAWSIQQVRIFNIAVRYQFFQSLGLLAMGAWLATRDLQSMPSERRLSVQRCRAATRLLLCGVVVFSGSLYALSLRAPRSVGLLTPIGGGLMIAAWGMFAVAAWRS